MTARRTAAFTLVEVLVASGLFVGIIGLSLSLWLNATADTFRGEDAMNTVQDAAVLVLRLRTDLLRVAARPDAPWALRWLAADEGATRAVGVAVEAAEGRLTAIRGEVPSASDASGDGRRRELTFFVGEDAGVRQVTYTFRPDRACIERTIEDGPTTMYALPRLQEFDVAVHCQPAPGSTATTDVVDLTAPSGPDAVAACRLWFRVLLSVRSDEEGRDRSAVTVDIESRVFPRFLNRQLTARWRPGS